MVELIEFTESEIQELQRLIEVHVHYTVLQRLFILTDNPRDKSQIFPTIYRILQSFQNYASTKELRKKLIALLEESKEIYAEIRPLVMKYENYDLNFGKHKILDEIIEILCTPSKNNKINKVIDAFIVFGEKIELNRMEDYMGLDTETDQGKEALKELTKVIEEERI